MGRSIPSSASSRLLSSIFLASVLSIFVAFSLLLMTQNILNQFVNQAASRESTKDALNHCRTPFTQNSALKDTEDSRCTEPALEASRETTCAEQSVLEDDPKEDREIRLTAEAAKAKQGENRTSQKSRTDGQESGDEEESGALRIVCDDGAETSDHVWARADLQVRCCFLRGLPSRMCALFLIDCAEVRTRGS